jgi:hypothetical protein
LVCEGKETRETPGALALLNSSSLALHCAALCFEGSVFTTVVASEVDSLGAFLYGFLSFILQLTASLNAGSICHRVCRCVYVCARLRLHNQPLPIKTSLFCLHLLMNTLETLPCHSQIERKHTASFLLLLFVCVCAHVHKGESGAKPVRKKKKVFIIVNKA